MTSEPTYYELLGVSSGATADEIKAAFRSQVKRNHPDQGGSPALFQMIEDAYNVLRDSQRRHEYDVWLASIGELTPPGGNRIPGGVEWTDGASKYENREPVDPTTMNPVVDDGPQVWSNEPSGDASQHGSDAFGDAGGDSYADGFYAGMAYSSQGQWEQEPNPQYLNTFGRHPHLVRLAKFVAVIALVAVIFVFKGATVGSAIQALLIIMFCWMAGPFLLRAAGWILGIYACVDAHWQDASGMLTAERLAIAAGLWLLGHWLYTFKSGNWRSTVAYGVLGKLPGQLRPDYRFTRSLVP